jgi:hypothetical protein
MKKEVSTFLVIGVLFLSIFSILFVFSFTSPSPNVNLGTGINHGDRWCVQVTKADGTKLPMYCGQNTYTTAGQNATRDLLGDGSAGPGFKYIALGNGTAPASTDTSLNSEITSGQNSGLARALGTYTSLPAPGNWTISNTFTSSQNSQVVNTTALFNDSSSGFELAGFSFTSATLQTNDQITINATIWTA